MDTVSPFIMMLAMVEARRVWMMLQKKQEWE